MLTQLMVVIVDSLVFSYFNDRENTFFLVIVKLTLDVPS